MNDLIQHLRTQVATYHVHVLYERETAFFLAVYDAQYRTKDEVRLALLRPLHEQAKTDLQTAVNDAVEQLNDTFQAGDRIRIYGADGFSEDRTYQYSGGWHIYTKDGSCTSGYPLVSTARVVLIHRAHSGRVNGEDGS